MVGRIFLITLMAGRLWAQKESRPQSLADLPISTALQAPLLPVAPQPAPAKPGARKSRSSKPGQAKTPDGQPAVTVPDTAQPADPQAYPSRSPKPSLENKPEARPPRIETPTEALPRPSDLALVKLQAFQGTLRAEPMSHGLRYRLQVRMRGEAMPMELHFRLVPTPARTTGNKVQKPRLGGWRLEAERGQGLLLIPAWILARAERLLYLSGPAPQLQREPWSLTFGKKTCPVWTVEVPPTLKASAYLVEIAPNLLALCDLHARFDRGDIASLDLQLEAFGWKHGTSSPENGTALLSSLQRWALQGSGSGETERVE